MDFGVRSYQKELLDGDNIPFEANRQNMVELDHINTWLGGHAISIAGLKALVGDREQFTVCEIGCGGGDNLQAIRRWGHRHKRRIQVIGIDMNRDCIAVAEARSWDGEAQFLVSDYRLVDFGEAGPDIIFASLFCHHFTDEELLHVLTWMKHNARIGFFINDLHRHRLAYYSIAWLTRLFSRSYLVKHDAPLSVLRGFSRSDWKRLLYSAGIQTSRARWKWAFRWLITVNNNE